ncbi:MAG: acetyl-CoA carboxylase biotin carboxyl carrier protein [Candidatus Brocadiia bacterium]
MEPVERIRELIKIMADHDLAELEVEEPDLRVKICRTKAPVAFPAGVMNPSQLQNPPGYHPALQSPAEPQAEPAPPAREESLIEITSPMVGTFYRAPNPGAESYVSIGSEVDAEDVVCIIEAMKVMNEIKAEVEGTIVEILVQDTEPVEYGQVLFLVEPAEA